MAALGIALPPGFEDFSQTAAPVTQERGTSASSFAAPGAAAPGAEPDLDDEGLRELQEFMRRKAEVEPAAARAVQQWFAQEGNATVEVSWGRPDDGGGKAGPDDGAGDGGATGGDAIPTHFEPDEVVQRELHGEDVRKFEDFGFPKEVLDAIYESGFVRPSKIQASALPIIVAQRGARGELKLGRNLIGQARNGSGKTAAFTLAVLSALDVGDRRPQAMVICPTRELARQNEAVVSALGKYLRVQTLLCLPQQERLPRNPEGHVIIGTPGKLMDLTQRRILDVSNVRVLVLDEADQLLDQENAMGTQVLQIKGALSQKRLQVLFFSATFPEHVKKFANHMSPQAAWLALRNEELSLSTVAQMYIRCDNEADKLERLMGLYGALSVSQSVVFVNARRRAFEIANSMKQAGHGVSLICGTQSQGEERMDPWLRDQVMEEFRTGITKVLVATDVLARGIDVPQVTLVVNYEFPMSYSRGSRDRVDCDTYLHRVGRTGRFGLRGIAVNLVLPAEEPRVTEICDYFQCRIDPMLADYDALEARLREIR